MLKRAGDEMLRRSRVTTRGWLLPSLLPLAVLLPLLALRHLRVIYTSDSVAQQSIVRTWLDVGHGTTTVPPDTWALKVPLYLVTELLPLTPRERLLTVVLVLNAVTFLALGWAVHRLASGSGTAVRWYEVAAPLAWFAALGGGVGSNRMLPNYRNIELGLSFVMLAVVAGYLARSSPRPQPSQSAQPVPPAQPVSRWRSLALGGGSAFLLGLLWFDDPFIELLVAGPLMLTALAWFWFRERDRRLLHLAAVLTASFAATELIRVIARLAGVRLHHEQQTLALSGADLSAHLGLLLPSTTLQLGIHDWNGSAADLIGQGLVVAACAAMLVATALLARRGWRQQRFVVTFLALHWPLVVGGFLISWQTQDVSAGRYLVLAFCDLVVATAVLLPELRVHRRAVATALVGLLTLGAGLSLGTGAAGAIEAARQPSVGLPHQQEVVAAVQRAGREHGAVKGYAPFWSGNITSYLAGGGTTTSEIFCRHGRLGSRRWLSDSARLTRPATAVFLIWDPQATGLAGCPAAVRDAQFGPPLATYPLNPTSVPTPGGSSDTVLVYATDIRARLQP